MEKLDINSLSSLQEPDQLKTKECKSEIFLRILAAWIAILGTSVFVGCFFGFLVCNYKELLPIGMKHFAATICLPLAAIGAVCLVLSLKAYTGPIEIEAFKVKFRGASGPIILWILCFLAMVFSIWLLWKLQI
jgi:hypothetical protein